MGILSYKIDPPETWQDFEKLCHLTWMAILNDQNIQMHGRQGQAQAGVDIYGTDSKTGQLVCIQCKGKDSNYGRKLTPKEIESEVEKAKKFGPKPPDIFIIATTAPNDILAQQKAREITLKHKDHGLFEVYAYGWAELKQRILFSPKAIEAYYSHLKSPTFDFLGGLPETVNKIAEAIGVGKLEGAISIDKGGIQKIFAAASSGLISWPRSLKLNNAWIQRKEHESLLLQFEDSYYSTSVLLGDPGTGKSALLSKITQELLDKGETVLALKADQLSEDVKDLDSLSKELNLPDRVDRCIISASRYSKVFVILDQLDTLSELVDVKTNRLSVLLNMVKALQEKPNVHVIASSRPFEFNYDLRLSSIEATKIQLEPIKWEVIEDVVKTVGIKIQNIDDSFKKFLCKPSNLNFYLTYIQDHPQKVFFSHIEMYEDIWANSLGRGKLKERRVALLLNAATEMTNDAKQILPIARYEIYSAEIDWLVSAGLLIKTNNKAFSFAHQTLQAFAWTRSFIQQNRSLGEFVTAHQNNLNVRPKLSTTLYYLRESDPEEYNRQISSILNKHGGEIRVHITYLLIDCICSQNEPNETEKALILGLIRNTALRGRICKNVSGKENWFDAVHSSVLQSLMHGSEEDKYFASLIFVPVYAQRKKKVLALIEQFGQSDGNDNHTYRILTMSRFWDEDLLEFAKRMLKTQTIHERAVSHIILMIKDKFPEIAIRLTAFYFSNKLECIIDAPAAPLDALPDDADEVDRIVHRIKTESKVECEKILEVESSWHFLSELAEKAPRILLEHFWPFFCKAAGLAITSYGQHESSYKRNSGIWFHLSDEDRDYKNAYLCSALEKGITLCAKNDPNYFLDFLNVNKSIDLMVVQRLLSKGVEILAEYNPDESLNYLLEDRRRLKLGARLYDDYCGTKNLIEEISKHLKENSRIQLENYIISYRPAISDLNPTADDKRYHLRKTRKIVYELLSCIPESVRSEAAKRIIREEERVLGKIKKSKKRASVLSAQVSPMSAEQMDKAQDINILKLLQEFPDNTDRSIKINGGRRIFYGSLELNRAFGTFSQAYPNRAANIILQLNGLNEETICHSLRGIAKSELDTKFLLDLILKLEANGNTGNQFHEEAAMAINEKLSSPDELSDEWCKHLETWMIEPNVAEIGQEQEDRTEDPESVKSILWDTGKFYILPHGNYSILQTITNGYFYRERPNANGWSSIIRQRLSIGGDEKVWKGFLAFQFPRTLRLCDQNDAEGIIDLLIESYPSVADTTEFAHTLAYAIHWASKEKLFEWLNILKASKNDETRQVAGEIFGLMRIIKSNDVEIDDEIKRSITTRRDSSFLYGLAFSLKNLWKKHEKLTTPYIVALFNLCDDNLSYILLGILRNYDDIEITHEALQILGCLITNKTLEKAKNKSGFIGRALSSITYLEPHRVAKLCSQIIDLHGRDLGDITTSAAGDTEDLITIALTLHNLGPDFQSIGLDIFERLLSYDTYHIKEALDDIDKTPQAVFIQ